MDTVKNRQAVAAAVSTFHLLLFLAYLGVKIVVYTIGKCKRHQEKLVEEELELMETQLQESKTKRIAAASRTKSSSPQE